MNMTLHCNTSFLGVCYKIIYKQCNMLIANIDFKNMIYYIFFCLIIFTTSLVQNSFITFTKL